MYKYDTFVIGGTGFIGEYLLSELLAQKKKVAVLHKNPLKDKFLPAVSYFLDSHPDKTIEKIVKKSRQIVFLIQPNLELLSRILSMIDCKKPVTILYASTSMIYHGGTLASKEKDELFPITQYAKEKYKEEKILSKYADNNHNARVIVVRLGNVYGDIKNRGLIALVFRSIIEKKELIIAGDGKQIRDFVLVDDVAKSLFILLTKNFNNNIIVNVATGIGHDLIEIIKKIEKITKQKLIYRFGPFIKETLIVKCDISYLKSLIEYYPNTKIDDGLQKMYKRLLLKYTSKK